MYTNKTVGLNPLPSGKLQHIKTLGTSVFVYSIGPHPHLSVSCHFLRRRRYMAEPSPLLFICPVSSHVDNPPAAAEQSLLCSKQKINNGSLTA